MAGCIGTGVSLDTHAFMQVEACCVVSLAQLEACTADALEHGHHERVAVRVGSDAVGVRLARQPGACALERARSVYAFGFGVAWRVGEEAFISICG